MAHATEIYELAPLPGQQKSFYGKAYVTVELDGTRTLTSYCSEVMRQDPDGTYHRLLDWWSATTGRHIKAFSGMNKAEYEALPYEG